MARPLYYSAIATTLHISLVLNLAWLATCLVLLFFGTIVAFYSEEGMGRQGRESGKDTQQSVVGLKPNL